MAISRASFLLFAAFALPAQAQEHACGGESPAQVAPRFCEQYRLQPAPRIEGIEPMARACITYFTKVLEGVELICSYRKEAEKLQERWKNASALAASQEEMFNGMKLINRDASRTYEQFSSAFFKKRNEIPVALGVYLRALRPLQGTISKTLQEELICKAGPKVHSFVVSAFAKYSVDHAAEAQLKMEEALQQAENLTRYSAQRRLAEVDRHAHLSQRLGDRLNPQANPQNPQDPSTNVPPAGPRQGGQIAGREINNHTKGPTANALKPHFRPDSGVPKFLGGTTGPLIGAALNLGVRKTLKGDLDWGDYVSVAVPTLIGIGVGGLTGNPNAGFGAAIVSGFATDAVESYFRGKYDILTIIKRDYPPFALQKLKANENATSAEVSQAFHREKNTGACEGAPRLPPR